MTVKLASREFARGPQRWRVDSQGNWTVLMFGWFPGNNGTPSHQWHPVDKKQFPQELLEAAHGL